MQATSESSASSDFQALDHVDVSKPRIPELFTSHFDLLCPCQFRVVPGLDSDGDESDSGWSEAEEWRPGFGSSRYKL